MSYTTEQVTAYVLFTQTHVDKHTTNIKQLTHLNISTTPAQPSLAYLTQLHQAHITTVPFETLSLHYTPLATPRITIDPSALLTKLLTNGRGGYCFESTIPFLHLILALGFTAYPAGARPRPRENGIPKGNYLGFTHIVLLVDLGPEGRYLVDAGYGGDGPIEPLPLAQNQTRSNIGAQECRLMFQPLDQTSQCLTKQEVWHYQCRTPTLPEKRGWVTYYVFTELEFLQSDFEVMSHFASTSPDSFMTHTPLCLKFTRDSQGRVVGRKMLVHGDVRLVDCDGSRSIRTCSSEEERIKALREEFGVVLTAEEIKGMRGKAGELPSVGL